MEPEPRHQESVCCGRQQFCCGRVAESDYDDPVAFDASVGIPRRTDACGKRVRWFLFFAAAGLWAAQPIPFSHKQHAGALKLQCKMCHPNPNPGESMTIAPASTCLQCHSAIKANSPAIQK